MDGIYAVAALAMRYWFLAAAAIVLLGVTGISIKEYSEKRFVLGIAKSSIGYLHVISGPEDIIDKNIQLMLENTIGRAKNVDIMLHDPSVSKAHSQVYMADGGVFINRLGRGEVVVNGIKVNSVAEVFDEDIVCFGNVVMRLHLKEVD